MYKESLLSFVASIILWAMAIGLGYLSAKGQPTIVEALFVCWAIVTAIMALVAMIATPFILSCKKENK